MMKSRYLLLWMLIFAAGCSTISPAANNTPGTTPGGKSTGIVAPEERAENHADGTSDEPGGQAAESQETSETIPEPPDIETTESVAPLQGEINRRVDEGKNYVIPPALLPYDGIPPVYEPRFVTSTESPLMDDELVMGVSIEGQAKAYPVTVLRFREMVNDELGGIPILVTW